MTSVQILDDQISCSTEDFDFDILSEVYSEILSEIKMLRKAAKFSEKLSAHKFDIMSAARFGSSSEFLEGIEGKPCSNFEPLNFPKMTPFMLPNLVKEENGQVYPIDSGKSHIFGSMAGRISLNRNGEFSLFDNLFSLIPDLQSQQRKANLVDLQKALRNENFFPQPISEAVSKININF